ncbi:MAG: CRTAC1 family protein, partial [Bacteroidota bacterium]
MRTRISLLLGMLSVCLAGQNYTNVAPSMGITQGFGDGNLGGGVSFCDFNGDGWDDLTFTSQLNDELYFFQNNNGTYQAIAPLVSNTAATKEAIWVDYDNDGDKDLFVTANGDANRLYRNTGGLNLVDVTLAALGELDSEPTFGAVWGDINRDGWLDLYVCHLNYGSGRTNDLFMNDGDGTFTKVSAHTVANDGPRPSFDAVFTDYDQDLWPDLYVINDRYDFANGMYHNSNGTFSDATASTGTGISINAMNAGGSDYDNDGDLDLYVTNTPEGNVLYQNNGNGTFTDVAAGAGVGFYRVGWASTFFDYDNDMDKDLYVSCISSNQLTSPNAFYINLGSTFSEPLANTGGLGGTDIGASFGHAVGDINNDGKLDIAVSQMFTDPFLLWRNNEANSNNWIKVHLTGTTSNADGIGSWIEVWTNGDRQVRFTHCSMGYLGQHSSDYHFGIGTNTMVDSIIVTWPSGLVDKVFNLSNINAVEYIS